MGRGGPVDRGLWSNIVFYIAAMETGPLACADMDIEYRSTLQLLGLLNGTGSVHTPCHKEMVSLQPECGQNRAGQR